MIEWIAKYWLEVAFGALVGWLTAWVKKRKAEDNKRDAENAAMKQAMLAILHDRLYNECTYYLKQEYIPIEKAEEIMNNVQLIYKAYSTLGGNSTGTDIYNRFRALPLEKEDDLEDDREIN